MYKPDGGRAWVVLFAAVLANGLITDGISYSFGLIFIEMLRVYDKSNEVTSWIGSFQLASGYVFCVFLGYFLEVTSCRTTMFVCSMITATSLMLSVFINNIYLLYVTLGGLAGIGFIGLELASQVAIQRWFVGKRLLANGMHCSGTGWGMLVMGPLVQWLLSYYGLHGTFLILTAISLNGIVSGMLIPKILPINEPESTQVGLYGELQETESCQPEDKSSKYQSFDQSLHDRSNIKDLNEEDADGNRCNLLKNNWMKRFWILLRNKRFIIYTIGSVLSHTAMKTTIFYYPGRAVKDFKFTESESAILVMVLGATNILGRPILGLLGSKDVSVKKKQIIYALSTVVAGVASIASIWFNTMALQVVFVVVFGLSCALLVTYEFPVLCDVIDMTDLEKAAGIYNTFLGLGILLFIPFSGWLVDLSGSYVLTFLVFGLVQFTSAVVLLVTPCLK